MNDDAHVRVGRQVTASLFTGSRPSPQHALATLCIAAPVGPGVQFWTCAATFRPPHKGRSFGTRDNLARTLLIGSSSLVRQSSAGQDPCLPTALSIADASPRLVRCCSRQTMGDGRWTMMAAYSNTWPVNKWSPATLVRVLDWGLYLLFLRVPRIWTWARQAYLKYGMMDVCLPCQRADAKRMPSSQEQVPSCPSDS